MYSIVLDEKTRMNAEEFGKKLFNLKDILLLIILY